MRIDMLRQGSPRIGIMLFALLALFAAHIVRGTEASPDFDAMTEEERREQFMKLTGGVVPVPGKGFVAVANCQSRASEEEVRYCVSWLGNITDVQHRYVAKKTPFDVRQAKRDLESYGANAALFIADDSALPMSLFAPEGRWAMVNTASFDVSDIGVFTNRFEKEVARAAALLLGSAVSQVPHSVMKPVFAEKDIDALTGETWMADALPGMQVKIAALGMTPNDVITYRKACFLGIAPPATNDYQRAVREGIRNGTIRMMKKENENE